MIAIRMTNDQKCKLRDLIEVVKGRIDANRRFIDDVLEKIQDRNHQYFLERLGSGLRQMEIDQKAGNLHSAMHRRVMARRIQIDTGG